MLTVPGLVSVYVVEQVPEESVLVELLKWPVLLFVLQVTVPAGLDPVTWAVHVIGEFAAPGLGEQTTEVEDFVGVSVNVMETVTPVPFTVTLPLFGEAVKPEGPVTE
jgi:hypothetical protein